MLPSDLTALAPVDPMQFGGIPQRTPPPMHPRMQQMLLQQMMQRRQAKDQNFGALGVLVNMMQQQQGARAQ